MRILFISSGKSGSQPSPIILAQSHSIIKEGVELVQFPIERKGFYGYLIESLRLARFIKKEKFDILHAHYGLAGFIGLIARKDEKLVVSFMGDDLVGSDTVNGSVTKVSLILARTNILISRKFYDFSIVKSAEMLALLGDSKSSVIPNGVDLNSFYEVNKQISRARLGFNPSDRIGLFIGNPDCPEKNFLLAKRAVDLMNDSLFKLIQVDSLSHSSLLDYYNAADLLVLTSFHEGSPNVVKEAMACNCPIVTTNVGDTEWVIGETRGCYFASFDPGDFVEKMKMALEFSKESDRTNGRERIIELGLDSVTIAKKIVSVYNMVLSRFK